MPNNQIDVKIQIDTPQADVATLAKLTEALKAAGAQGGGGRIQEQFGTVTEGMEYLRQEQAQAKALGGRLSGATVKATNEGYEASAKVNGDEGQKKAFQPGGAIAVIGTGVVGIASGFKQLLGMSKIFQTFMGTTGKILATAVDIMLAPLMPFFMRIMVWLIQKAFPIARDVGDFVNKFGDAGGAALLAGGYVALKFGPTLLKKAGESLGIALVNKMPYETLGANISAGISLAKKTLVTWGTTVGGYVVEGVKAGKTALLALGTGIGNAVTASFVGAKLAMVKVGAAIGIGQAGGFIGMKATMVLIGKAIGLAMGAAFTGMRTAFIFLGTAIGVAMGGGFTGSHLTMTALATKLGLAMSAGFTSAKLVMVAIGTSIGIGQAGGFIGMKATMVLIGTAIGAAMGTAFKAGRAAFILIGTAIGVAMGGGFTGSNLAMTALSTRLGTAMGAGLATAIRLAPAWVAIGGTIAAALGVAAIGAAIGYAMWKSYKSHEAGKDIFEGKTYAEVYSSLRNQYGMGVERAAAITESVQAREGEPYFEAISTSMDAFGDFAMAFDDIATLLRTGVDHPRAMEKFKPVFETLEKSEIQFIMDFFQNQIDKGLSPYSQEEINTLTAEVNRLIELKFFSVSRLISNEGEVTAASNIYSREQETLGNQALQSIGSAVTYAPDIFNKANEKQYREILNELYEVKKFTETYFTFASIMPGVGRPWTIPADELSEQDREIAMALLMTRDPSTALRFISPERREQLGFGEWGETELGRMQRTKDINIYIQGMAVDWDMDPNLLDKVMKELEFYQNGAVQPSP